MLGLPMFGAPVQFGTPGALALDAADGVIDGKFFGRPIVQATPIVARNVLPAAAGALALDAADGVIDGRYFGRPIVQSAYQTPFSPFSTAANIDAADGVMDGKFFGAKIVEVPATGFATSVVLPPTDLSLVTNVPPLGTTSVSVVDCHGMPTAGAVLPPFQANQSSFTSVDQTLIIKRDIPGAVTLANEFRDLRDMLERDRISFERTRAEYERSMAERELKLKMEQEKLKVDGERLRAEWARLEQQKRVPPPNPNVITVNSVKEAQELDMRDGIIDGKYQGKQIVVAGSGPLIPPPHLMGKPVGGKGKGGKGAPPPAGGKGFQGLGGKGGPPPGQGAPGAFQGLPPGSPPKFVLNQIPPAAGKGAPGKGSPPPPAMKGGKGGEFQGMPAGKGKGGEFQGIPPGKGGRGMP